MIIMHDDMQKLYYFTTWVFHIFIELSFVYSKIMTLDINFIYSDLFIHELYSKFVHNSIFLNWFWLFYHRQDILTLYSNKWKREERERLWEYSQDKSIYYDQFPSSPYWISEVEKLKYHYLETY